MDDDFFKSLFGSFRSDATKYEHGGAWHQYLKDNSIFIPYRAPLSEVLSYDLAESAPNKKKRKAKSKKIIKTLQLVVNNGKSNLRDH